MKRFFRWLGGLFLVTLLVVGVFLVNFIWFRPFSIALFYERAFIEFALEDPELLTSIRLLEGFGITGHNAELTDASPAQTTRMRDLFRKDLEILHRYDRSDLDGQTALSYDILEWYLEQQARGDPFIWHEYALNHLFGVHTMLPTFMVDEHQVSSVRDAEHYVARLSKFGWKFDGLLESLELREERGIVPPNFSIAKMIDQVGIFIEPAPDRNVLYESLAEKLDAVEGLTTETRKRLLGDAEREIDNTVYPAYRKLEAYLENLRAKISTNHGVWNLPDGDAYYAYKLVEHTTTDMSADEIHSLGLAEISRIESEMDVILRSEGYFEGTVGERMKGLNEEPRFFWPETDEAREEILGFYEDLVRKAQSEIGDYFVREPGTPIEVRRMPGYMEPGAAMAAYAAPAFDGSRPGFFYVNLRSTGEHPRFLMPVVAYHEGVPGHHFQGALQRELEGVAQFRRIIPFTAYHEGWGLYSEQLAAEMNLYDDPYAQLGRWQTELLRAVRLVVDTGIHQKRWSRERAIDYMLAHTGIVEDDVIAEIERYFVEPGQATAYKVGMMKILELRQRAQDRLGERFDIRGFHDVVLRNGAMPLVILEQQVEDYIAGANASTPSRYQATP